MRDLKRVASLVIIGIIFLSAFSAAAYLKNFPLQVRQPDGTPLDCFASGDEFYNWLHDAAGRTIVQDPKSGWYVYALKTDGRLAASPYIAGLARIQDVKIPAAQIQDFEFRTSPQRLFPRGSASTFEEIQSAPRKGAIANLVIFIRFSDEAEFADSFSFYDTMFNSSTVGANSMRNYFKEASYNQLSVTSTLYPSPGGSTVVSYKDAQPRSYYQPYNAGTNPGGYTDSQRTEREHVLLKNAVNAVSSQVPAGLPIDGDGDGYADNVCFIVSGSPGGWSSLLWPHMWSLYSQSAYINGKRVYTYNFQLQNSLKSGGGNVGVLCHEMFHALGSPDLYHYSFDGLHPVGTWDVMEYSTNPPQHMGAYMKYRYGTWISSIPSITTSGTYTLNPLSSSSSGNCFKIPSPKSGSQYYLVEYRRKTGGYFDNGLPGEGLLVYRIDTNQNGQGNRNGPPDEVYIYRPGGTKTQDGTYSTANFSQDFLRVQMNDTTNPSSFLSDGSAGGLDLSAVGSVGSAISFTVNLGDMPSLSLSETALNFGAMAGGAKSPDQSFNISSGGSGALSWTVTDNAGWLSCTPASGTGIQKIISAVNTNGLAAGTYTASITVSASGATNSPQTVDVTLRVYGAGGDSGPFGSFDTPTDASTVSGSVAVTGWALDDVEVKKVEIKRDLHALDPAGAAGPDGLVYIGDAVLIKGARPDVESLYPNHPQHDRAGWGYMMLTHGLPNKGNGTYRLHAIAEDAAGRKAILGTKQITSANASRVKPFGTIDTPGQGAVVSGAGYLSFGWALTPPPNIIPTNGSTVWLSIDSLTIGHPAYNQHRPDIAAAFPECLNANGAVGVYELDTTKYANGIHTIGWLVYDNLNNGDGMGSRFFEINNPGSTPPPDAGEALRYEEDAGGRLEIEVLGPKRIRIEELGRVEVVFKGRGGIRTLGWGATKENPLPVGSTIDAENGVFYWSPAPGFLGTHRLHFAVTDGTRVSRPVEIVVQIVPKNYEKSPRKDRDRNQN